MSRPASLRPQRAFVGKNKKQGSKKLELDWDKIDPSFNHNFNRDINYVSLQNLRRDLIAAEEAGRHSKAKKIRRLINQELEFGLSLQATFCGGCGQVLHRCRCKDLRATTIHRKKKRAEAANNYKLATDLIHIILNRK